MRKNLLILFVLGILMLVIPQTIFAKEIKSNLKVEIIYFHATIRCEACLLIENQSREIINLTYQNELKNRTLSFESLDFQDDKNQKYVEQYEIETQTLIVQIVSGSKVIKWKKLEKIWDYLNNFDKFHQYLVNEINEYLKEVKNAESSN